MISIEYANAYNEVLEILKYISKEDYNRIPIEQIKLFEANANSNHIFSYNPEKTLDEQNVLKITKGIIAILFRDYWATLEQKNKILNYEKNETIKEENIKKEKYNSNDIFKNNTKSTIIENKDNIQEKSLVNVSNIKWYEKIWKILKDFFKK